MLRCVVESGWNVLTHGDAREGKWRGNWRMEWVISTLHTTSEHGVTSITTADPHTSVVSSRLNWLSRRFKWTLPFRRKTKSGFCAYAIIFQMQSTIARYSSDLHPHINSWLPNEVFCKKVSLIDDGACYRTQYVRIQYKLFRPHTFITSSSPIRSLSDTSSANGNIPDLCDRYRGLYLYQSSWDVCCSSI